MSSRVKFFSGMAPNGVELTVSRAIIR